MSTGLAPVQEVAALVMVDRALDVASDREFFTSDEAASLLEDVRANVHDLALTSVVTSVVDDALLSYRDQVIVDRSRVVDPLLDLRLALSRELTREGVQRAAR
jgi:hypothetical protein